MAITLLNTWGLSNSNSYVSLDEAKNLIAQYVMNSDSWDDADDTLQSKALLIATQTIDSQNWHGERFYWNQNLNFPRIPPGGDRLLGVGGDATSDGAASYYTLLMYDEYSRKQISRVKLAQCYQAVVILNSNTGNRRGDSHKALQTKGITSWSKSGGGISESYSYGAVNADLSPEAWDVLRYYKAPRAVVRGSAKSWEYE
mgnify:CR=1 FL=1